MKPYLCIVLAVLLTSPTAYLQPGAKEVSLQIEDTFLNRLAGNWEGEGRVSGMESKLSMNWQQTLGGKFMRLTFRNEMRGRDGSSQVFEGHAYYKVAASNRYEGTWFDSQGAIHPIKATIDNQALISLWGSKETQQGRTIYRLTDDERIEVIDSLLSRDGSWKEFGRSLFRRR